MAALAGAGLLLIARSALQESAQPAREKVVEHKRQHTPAEPPRIIEQHQVGEDAELIYWGSPSRWGRQEELFASLMPQQHPNCVIYRDRFRAAITCDINKPTSSPD